MLLWLHRRRLVQLLRWGQLVVLLWLLHLGRFALPLLLLLHIGRLLLLLRCLALLLLLLRLALLLLHVGRLMLLLLLLRPLRLLLHRWSLTLLVLRVRLIAGPYLGRHTNVVIGRKRLFDRHAGWTAMVDIGELSPVAAGNMLVLELRSHWGSVLFVASRQFCWSSTHLQSA